MNSLSIRKESVMARKFRSGQVFRSIPSPDFDFDVFRKQYCFFYGSLADSSRLGKVLGFNESPVLHPAKIIGYHCKFWGTYPALLDGPPGATIHGVAYEVQSSEEVQRLRAYETDNYRDVPCFIYIEGRGKVFGCTFKWDGEESFLTENPGSGS